MVAKRSLTYVVVLALLFLTITVEDATPSVATNTSLPTIALIPLWSVNHESYTAGFVGDKYVVVFAGHGDVALNGRYVSTCGTAYVYRVSDGKLLATLSGPATYEVVSWEPFEAKKLADVCGFFSGNSERLIADPRVHGGTDIRVYWVSPPPWVGIPIDFGFTDTDGRHFYAVQLDYYGLTAVIGYIYGHKMIVVEYNATEGKFVKIFEHQEYGDYGRRLQMTLDAKYILIGGLNYPYLDIWKWNGTTYVRVVHYQLPDNGGLGALGISDPWNIGYIIAGTYNGWVIIAYYNTTADEFKVIYQAKLAPDGSWFYNPFYNRWIPKTTEVFALCTHRDRSRPGVAVIYDVYTNRTVVINFAGAGTPEWKAAAVSPSGTYVFVGNTLYMVVKRDVLSGQPRLRIWAHMKWNNTVELSTPITLTAPKRNWTLLFLDGRVEICKLEYTPIPVSLVDRIYIKQGLVSKMVEIGLVKPLKLRFEHATTTDLALLTGKEAREVFEKFGVHDLDHYAVMFAVTRFTPPPYIATGKAWYGLVLRIPLARPMAPYTDIRLVGGLTVAVANIYYDKDRRAIALGIMPLAITAASSAAPLDPWVATKILFDAAYWRYKISVGKVKKLKPYIIAGAVGAAVSPLAALEALAVSSGFISSIDTKGIVAFVPVVEDKYGNKYAAVKLLLPSEASSELQTYYDLLKEYAKRMGLKDIGLDVYYPCETWKEYTSLLQGGFNPKIRLDALIESTIGAKYNLTLDELKLVEVDVVVISMSSAKSTFWEWYFGLGGVYVDTEILVGVSSLDVKAVTKYRVVTDPAQIAEEIGTVVINGVKYRPRVGDKCAYVDFSLPFGSDKLVIEFRGVSPGVKGELHIKTTTIVEKVMKPLGDFGYTTGTIHYDFNIPMRIDRIEFVDMPYPMVKAERIYIYRYGKTINDITDAFELEKVIDYEASPTGKLYYYITVKNTKYIDPANGGTLQPCKTFIFNYYYKQPPNAWIKVYLNGTSITSTLAHHATVVVGSDIVNQTITYNLTVSVKYFEGIEEKVIDAVTFTDNITVPANSTTYKTYDISKYVDEAIQFARSHGKPAFVEVVAKIVKAEYNSLESDDEYRVVYYPPLSIQGLYPTGNYTVRVQVINPLTQEPVQGAKVYVYLGNRLVAEATTDENGMAVFTLPAGTYRFLIVAPGFPPVEYIQPVYNDTIFRFYLLPPEVPKPSPILNNTKTPVIVNGTEYYWLGVQVLWGNYLPFHGAIVSVYDNVTGELVSSLETNGTGTVWFLLPTGNYTVVVNATNPYENTTYTKTLYVTLDSHKFFMVVLPWWPPEPWNKAYTVVVHAYDALTNEGVAGATLLIHKGLLAYLAKTNETGYATLYVPLPGLWVVEAYHPDYMAVNRSIIITENITVIEIPMLPKEAIVPVLPPVNGTYPPVVINNTEYYWLSIQVVYNDGYPFHGATVAVYNNETGELIATRVTNGTGFAHFLLPANTTVKVVVNATEGNQTFTWEKVVPMTQHWYFVVRVPWTSRFYQPEVWLKSAEIRIHRGQAWLWGPVPHLVLLKIWTNKAQNVTIELKLYKIVGGNLTLVSTKEVTVSLAEGLNTIMEWVEVNDTSGGWFQVFANITSWEYDTDLSNNYAWSNKVYLKPFVDIHVSVSWRPVKQKIRYALLPGDIIEICIAVKLPINTSSIPATLHWSLESMDVKAGKLKAIKVVDEYIRAAKAGIVWKNMTIEVPWTSKIVLTVNVTHPWEDMPLNNNVTLVIPVDPDVRLSIEGLPVKAVGEGGTIKIRVKLEANVEPNVTIGWVSVVDETTGDLLGRVEVPLEPEKVIEIEVRAPQNPPMITIPVTPWWSIVVRKPVATHKLTVSFAGYDLYTGNNNATVTVAVVSNQWIGVIAAIALIIAIIVAAMVITKILVGAIHGYEREKRFVKRTTKRFVRRKP